MALPSRPLPANVLADPEERTDRPAVVRIRPASGWTSLGLGDLWHYRELVYFLTWRDIKVRYKQTVLGAAWAVMQPFLAMVVFTVFFGRLAHMPSDGIPYPIFSFAGLVPWTFFASGLSQSSQVLVGNSNLVTKVYFPRLAMPIASVTSGLVDLAIALCVLGGLMAYYGISPSIQIVWLPLLVLLAVAAALGMGTWLSAMNVKFRDVRYVVPFMVQLWMFVTPVVYPSSLVAEKWRTLLGLNPMTGVVDGFRWALLGTPRPDAAMMIVSASSALVLLITGCYYFRRMEASFADLV